jgi:hypothetical protein
MTLKIGFIIAGVILIIAFLSVVGYLIFYFVNKDDEEDAELKRQAEEQKRIDRQKELDRQAALNKQKAQEQQRAADLQRAQELQRAIDLQKAIELEKAQELQRAKELQVAISIKNEIAQQREVAVQKEIEQQNAGHPTYTFYPNVESREGNIVRIRDTDVPSLKDWCSTRPDCLGFNTSGWMKNTIAPMSDWWTFTEDSSQGLYLKDLKPVEQSQLTYDFHPFMDSGGNDITNVTGDVPQMQDWCSANTECLGFNTNGWMKRAIQPQSEWQSWTDDSLKGLYVKRL